LWNAPYVGASNESGFTGLPGGQRDNTDSYFSGLGLIGYWWSSTLYTPMLRRSMSIFRNNADYFRGSNLITGGYCLRCIMD